MMRRICLILFATLLPSAIAAQSASDELSLPDLALQPPRVTADFDQDRVKSARGAQGVPAVERTSKGTIYIIYDHQRYTLNREGNKGVGSVQMAMFHEEDVRAGKPVSENVRLQVDVTRLRSASESCD